MDTTTNAPFTLPDSFVAVLDRLSQTPTLAEHCLGDAQVQINYGQLPDYFTAIENCLQNQGVELNDCVAFECQNTTAALITLLALFYRGQHFLLLPPQGNPLKEPDFKPEIPAFCKTHITVSELDSAAELNTETMPALLNLYSHEDFDKQAYKRLNLSTRRLMIRTSGSMGDAKIVLFSHRHLLGNAFNCIARFNLQPSSRVSIAVPVFHMYGLGAGFIPSLLAGASIDVQANTNILRFMEHERRFNPDVIYLNPTLCTMLLKFRRQKKPFTQTISAGEALQESIYQEYRDRFGSFTNLYGSSEMGAAATACAQSNEEKHTHLKPMPNVEFTIDSDNKTLHCTHPDGFDGYIDSRGQMISIKTTPFNTGDMAHLLDNGCFEFIDRKSNSINRMGFLVQFDDIEKSLLKIKGVEQAVVLNNQEHTVRGQKLFAFCTTNTADNTPQNIREQCAKLLPKYAVPDDIIVLKKFPLLPNGKVDRQTLHQQTTNKNQELTL